MKVQHFFLPPILHSAFNDAESELRHWSFLNYAYLPSQKRPQGRQDLISKCLPRTMSGNAHPRAMNTYSRLELRASQASTEDCLSIFVSCSLLITLVSTKMTRLPTATVPSTGALTSWMLSRQVPRLLVFSRQIRDNSSDIPTMGRSFGLHLPSKHTLRATIWTSTFRLACSTRLLTTIMSMTSRITLAHRQPFRPIPTTSSCPPMLRMSSNSVLGKM